MPHLRNIIYFNERRMLELFGQIAERRRPKLKLDELSLGLNAGVLDMSGTVRPTDAPAPVFTTVLDAVVDELRESGQLFAHRPESTTEYQAVGGAYYVYEFTSATRVYLPTSEAAQASGAPPELTIWVSDAPAETRPSEGLTPHSLRRTFASALYAIGEAPTIVMAEMGHTDPGLALRLYAAAMRRDADENESLRVLIDREGLCEESAEIGRKAERRPPRSSGTTPRGRRETSREAGS